MSAYWNGILLRASSDGALPELKEALVSGADINSVDEKSDVTSLMEAARHGHADCVQYLLDTGAALDSVDNFGDTSLIWATVYGHTDCVQILIDAGAMRDIADDFGKTALILAADHGHADCVQLLIDAGAALGMKDINGKSALISAAELGYTECVRVLIPAGADINSLEGEDKARYSSIIDVELKKRAEKEAREQQKVKLVMQEKKRKTFRKQMRSRGL